MFELESRIVTQDALRVSCSEKSGVAEISPAVHVLGPVVVARSSEFRGVVHLPAPEDKDAGAVTTGAENGPVPLAVLQERSLNDIVTPANDVHVGRVVIRPGLRQPCIREPPENG